MSHLLKYEREEIEQKWYFDKCKIISLSKSSLERKICSNWFSLKHVQNAVISRASSRSPCLSVHPYIHVFKLMLMSKLTMKTFIQQTEGDHDACVEAWGEVNQRQINGCLDPAAIKTYVSGHTMIHLFMHSQCTVLNSVFIYIRLIWNLFFHICFYFIVLFQERGPYIWFPR